MRFFEELRRHVALGCLALALASAAGCSLGEGEGTIRGTLNVPNCWTGPFDLAPDFFAAIPYRNTLQIRIQNGGDFQSFSDGISILVADVQKVHGTGPDNPGLLGVPLKVSLPPEVTPPGVPIVAEADPTPVHIALYMQRSCRTQNVALHVVEEVLLAEDGRCDADLSKQSVCPNTSQTAQEPGSVPTSTPNGGEDSPLVTGKSTITFSHLFSGAADETNAEKRLTEATFDVFLADPRDICPGGFGPPPRCRGHLRGSFKFYFQRGRPGQPFP